jgi:hypothetical protein
LSTDTPTFLYFLCSQTEILAVTVLGCVHAASQTDHLLPKNTRKIEQILEGIATKAKALAALEGSDALAWLKTKSA